MPAMPLMPAVELVMMIDPPLPASIIAGIAALSVFQTPVRLTASISSHASSSIDHALGENVAMPALALTMSRRPSSDTPSCTEPAHGGRVAHVGLAGDDAPVEVLDLPRGLLEVLRRRHLVAHRGQLLADVERDDVRALLRQPHRVRATLPPRRPGDQRDLALEPSSH